MVKILDRQGLDAKSLDRLDRPDSTRTPMRSSPTRRNGLVPLKSLVRSLVRLAVCGGRVTIRARDFYEVIVACFLP